MKVTIFSLCVGFNLVFPATAGPLSPFTGLPEMKKMTSKKNNLYTSIPTDLPRNSKKGSNAPKTEKSNKMDPTAVPKVEKNKKNEERKGRALQMKLRSDQQSKNTGLPEMKKLTSKKNNVYTSVPTDLPRISKKGSNAPKTEKSNKMDPTAVPKADKNKKKEEPKGRALQMKLRSKQQSKNDMDGDLLTLSPTERSSVNTSPPTKSSSKGMKRNENGKVRSPILFNPPSNAPTTYEDMHPY